MQNKHTALYKIRIKEQKHWNAEAWILKITYMFLVLTKIFEIKNLRLYKSWNFICVGTEEKGWGERLVLLLYIAIVYNLWSACTCISKHSDDLRGKKLELSSLSFNNIRRGTTKRGKWPSYDVKGLIGAFA